jgi:diguanylate cyclase (GGDEF)-like protein
MLRLRSHLTGPYATITLLITAAAGTLLSMVIAWALMYGNTQRLITSAEWVQHTQEVLTSLQRASQLTERVESNTRLYLLSGDEEQLNRARTGASLLVTTAAHLGMLVSDNPEQTRNVQNLAQEASDLKQILNQFLPKSAAPEIQIQRCQHTIGLLTDREQWLLKERNQGSQHSSLRSIITEISYFAISLAISILLFSLLLRDAYRRKRVERLTMETNERLAQSVRALENRVRESHLLTAARDELQLCVDVAQVYQSAANTFSRLLNGSSGCLCIINNSRQMVEVVSKWGEPRLEDFSPLEACCGLRSGQARWRLPELSEIHCTHFPAEPPQRYLCRPMSAHGNTLGILYVECDNEAIVTTVNEHLDGMRQLLQITGMAVATLNLRTKLENQSIHDPLTGLFNRHFMQISLERELARAARRNQMLAIFMLDVDHFKRFNDTYGHAAGDVALKAIAEIFTSRIRNEDIACRYGGEEFTIMLPDMTASLALERAETIRRAIASLHVPVGRDLIGGFSISIGIAVYPQNGENADLLLRRADLALYRAKHEGRNQVVLYQATIEETAAAKP